MKFSRKTGQRDGRDGVFVEVPSAHFERDAEVGCVAAVEGDAECADGGEAGGGDDVSAVPTSSGDW